MKQDKAPFVRGYAGSRVHRRVTPLRFLRLPYHQSSVASSLGG